MTVPFPPPEFFFRVSTAERKGRTSYERKIQQRARNATLYVRKRLPGPLHNRWLPGSVPASLGGEAAKLGSFVLAGTKHAGAGGRPGPPGRRGGGAGAGAARGAN